jgi:hypothetical protein
MKILIVALLSGMVVALPSVEQSAQLQGPEDPYDIANTRALISLAQAKPSVTVGSAETHNTHMGDSATIAIIKIYSEDELLKPANVEAYLHVIGVAFAAPNVILRKEDRDPKATLFLLHFLDKNLKDAGLKKQVAELESRVSKFQVAESK